MFEPVKIKSTFNKSFITHEFNGNSYEKLFLYKCLQIIKNLLFIN